MSELAGEPSAQRTVVMLSPGYPAEMPYFTRALATVGAQVIGVGDQPPHELPAVARDALAHYEHVSLADEGAASPRSAASTAPSSASDTCS